MNGKHGDHPLTDVLGYGLEVYGREADDLIRKIAALCSERELDEWWRKEIDWSEDRALVLRKARTRYHELSERARESGWETTLQIPPEAIAARSLVLHPEATDLVVAETAEDGKEHLLIAPAASAWRAMKSAALADGVVIRIVSAFRTIERQTEIVRTKMAKGLSLESILCVSAPPGYSEHHSGRAIDVTTDGVRALEEEFEHTDAFRWLSANAGRFGFRLSFPRGNRYGYAYEPWHWCFEVAQA